MSVTVVAVGSHYLLGLPWELAILLGAVTSPTDAAAVFSVLRTVPLPRRLSGALEAESGLNDAPTVVLVTLVSSGALHEQGVGQMVGTVALELVLGVVSGLVIGFGGAWILRRIALPASGLYPIAVLCLAFLAYGGAAAVHGSGFAAIYVAALILGNSELPHRAASRSFAGGHRLAGPDRPVRDARPAALARPDHPVDDRAGRRRRPDPHRSSPGRSRCWSAASSSPCPGASSPSSRGPGCAAPSPSSSPRSRSPPRSTGPTRLFDLVFVMVVIYTLLTGPTLPLAARWLRVARRSEPRGLEVEAAPLEKVAADLLQVTISPRSRMHGVEVGELRLPTGASVSLVIREGRALVPEPRTALRTGDDLRRRHPAQAARGDREAAAPGRRRRPARRLARRLGDACE